ncbi:MAG: hypothetical protein ACJ77K_08060 [Bacteroidia bacterium]
MEAATQVKLLSLAPYRHLFPAAEVKDKTIKMGATVADTVDFIPMIVQKTRWQVEKFVDQELRGLSTYTACEKLWHFVKFHIRYKKDKRGLEQVRSSRRLIHDGVGDCDCFTTFIDTCLTELGIKGIINRITKYDGKEYFQHIYPVVPLGDGSYIIMDCVADKFNYEVPYTEKKDHNMDLQFLDGIQTDGAFAGNVDAQDLLGWGENGDLGKLFKKRSGGSSAMPSENQGGKKGKKGFQKFKKIAKKVLNVTNKANPATAVLRAGILASMKTNVMKVAEKLKWAYLSEAEAKKKGADMNKFGKLKNVLYKIEQIFYTAGGKPENLKKAILSGRGNRHHEVSGFGLIGIDEIQAYGIDDNAPLEQLLGDIYHDEFVSGLEGTEGLGVIATSASIAAASTVMGTIAALLKSIGSLFPKKKEGSGGGSEDGGSGDGGSSDEGSNSGGGESSEPTVDVNSGDDNAPKQKSNVPAKTNPNTPATNDDAGDSGGGEDNTDGTNTKSKTPATTDDAEPTGLKKFWEDNKKWMKPVGIGLGVAAVLYAGYRLIKKGKEKKPNTNGQVALNGFNSRKHHKRKKGKKGNAGKKSGIALM